MDEIRPPRQRQDNTPASADTFCVGEEPVITVARRGKRGMFTADFRYDRRHRRRALRTASRLLAQRAALRIHNELLAGRYEAPLRPMPLSAGLKVYTDACRGRHLRQATIVCYETAGNALIRFLVARNVTHAGQVTPAHLEQYKAARSDLHTNTLNNQIVILKTWFKYLAKHKHITHDPLADVDNVQPGHTDHPAASADQVSAMLRSTNGDLQAIIALGAYAGLRISEALFLAVTDVDLTADLIHVRETPERKLKNQNAARDVPIHPSLRPLLAGLVGSRVGSRLAGPDVFPDGRRSQGSGVRDWRTPP